MGNNMGMVQKGPYESKHEFLYPSFPYNQCLDFHGERITSFHVWQTPKIFEGDELFHPTITTFFFQGGWWVKSLQFDGLAFFDNLKIIDGPYKNKNLTF